MNSSKKITSSPFDRTATTLKPWETLKSRDLMEDMPWLKLSVEHVLLPNGTEIENFYQIHLPEYAVVVAQTREGLVIMERQYKHATGEVILNLPAGYLDPDETPAACARRELLEETGFKAESWHHLGTFCVDGNRGCGKMHAFVGVGAFRFSEPCSEEAEELEVLLRKPEDALRSLLNGEIITVGAAIALSLAFLSPSSPLSKSRKASGSQKE